MFDSSLEYGTMKESRGERDFFVAIRRKDPQFAKNPSAPSTSADGPQTVGLCVSLKRRN